jgi:UDP:flavonoid glycosyltransferase YjiC (YdhE family)
MYFGKPMIVLPIFWDQHDNAQRVHETSFGTRLPTYSFEEDELTGAIDRLLKDQALRHRMAAVSERLQSRPGTKRAADLIEQLAARAEPIVSG